MQQSVAGFTCKTAYARQAAALFLISILTVGCDSVDYGTVDRETRRDNKLAYVNFDRGENEDPYAVHLSRDRNRRGYAIQAPLHNASDQMRTHFTVSRTKEYRWFSGLQFSWDF